MATSRPQAPTILCIDDAEVALRIRKLLLANAGYSIITARSGEEGLELLKMNNVDLVVADHFLTDKSGAEIALEMKQAKPEVPVLIVSAAAEKPAGIEFADAFLSKGEGPEALLRVIADMLNQGYSKHA